MGPLVVELFEESVELALLLQAVAARGARGLRFERQVHAFMAAVLLRMAGLDAFDGNAQPQPPDGESGKLKRPLGEAKGTPLSERMAWGRPRSLNKRSKAVKAPVPRSTPWPRRATDNAEHDR